MTPYREIENIYHLRALIAEMGADRVFRHTAFQDVDLMEVSLDGYSFSDCLFLNCNMTRDLERRMDSKCAIFPGIDRPYQMFRSSLYDAEALYGNYADGAGWSLDKSYDAFVYKHYKAEGNPAADIKETFSRSIHDFSMSDALQGFLTGYDERSIVAVMGGHSISRADEGYAKVARVSKELTEKGKLMVSGGGPGAMEATHLGAWMAGRSDEELQDALETLAAAPTFRDSGWLESAFEVMLRYPRGNYESLGIPTWLYGHEPATPFASHIAKYFDNSIREDTILSIAKGGIIYTPGSAGTVQEIFQDAAQNHYESMDYASPMVFMGRKFFTETIPVYTLLSDLSERGLFKNLILSLTDEPSEVVGNIMAFGNDNQQQ